MSNQKSEKAPDIFDKDIFGKNSLLPLEPKQLTMFIGSKLFFNFFSWFIAIAISMFCLAYAYNYFFHYRPAQKEIINIALEILKDNGQMMVEAYDNYGPKGLNRFRWPGTSRLYDENLRDLFCPEQTNACDSKQDCLPQCDLIQHTDKSTQTIEMLPPFTPKGKINPYLQKNHFKELAKSFFKEHDNQIKEFVKTLFKKTGTDILTIRNENIAGCHFVSEKGNKYVAIVYIPEKIPGVEEKYVLFKRPQRVLTAFIILCAILCYSMARYVAKPIIELQNASRKFANGDFSQKITEKSKKRNDELGELATDFNDMAERIESGIKSQKRLFNDISHELRSPLARMQIALELLQMKANDNEKSLISRLEKDVERMNLLISELLQFSKLENKEIGRATEEINLSESLEEICNNAEFEGKKVNKNVKLTIKQNCFIKGNLALIERACENVIRNALRFTPENTTVEIELDQTDNQAIITIMDKGPGVPEEEIEKIFAPFYSVNQDRNPQKNGIGLGLSIALRAIQLHNGTIQMANRENGGLVATISLPLV